MPTTTSLTLTKPAGKNEKVITIIDCPDWECAAILVNGKSVFSGNYWDFHAGCIGTTIGGFNLTNQWDSGMDSLVTILKMNYEKMGKTVITETIEADEDQYEDLT